MKKTHTLKKTAKWVAITLAALFVVFMSFGLGGLVGYDLATNGSAGPQAEEGADVRWQLYQLTNNEREKAGLNWLDYSPYLAASAQAKCEDMATRNYWTHNTPEGQEPWKFIEEKGVQYSSAAENQAYGQDNVSDVVRDWMNSKTHRENILAPDLKEVGFGVCVADNFQGNSNQTIVVQHFIAP